MIILLVGPSGIGKTTSYRAVAEQLPQCVFDHLDGLASRRALRLGLIERESVSLLRDHIGDDELFLGFGLEAVAEFELLNTGRHVVVDVGAGFLDAQCAVNLRQIHKVVALTATPEVAYRRFVRLRHARDQGEYCRTEFSEHRGRVYSSADLMIDSTLLTKEETASRLAMGLKKLLG